jgi:hypothetical protein
MNYTKRALLLMKKYAAKCNIDWNNLSGRVFQYHLEMRVKSRGGKKITVDDVRWYWLKKHNSTLKKLFTAGKIKKQDMNYCSVLIKNGCVFHQGMFVEKVRSS